MVRARSSAKADTGMQDTRAMQAVQDLPALEAIKASVFAMIGESFISFARAAIALPCSIRE